MNEMLDWIQIVRNLQELELTLDEILYSVLERFPEAEDLPKMQHTSLSETLKRVKEKKARFERNLYREISEHCYRCCGKFSEIADGNHVHNRKGFDYCSRCLDAVLHENEPPGILQNSAQFKEFNEYLELYCGINSYPWHVKSTILHILCGYYSLIPEKVRTRNRLSIKIRASFEAAHDSDNQEKAP